MVGDWAVIGPSRPRPRLFGDGTRRGDPALGGLRAQHYPLGLRLCGVCQQGWAAEGVGGCFGNELDGLIKEMNEELVV